VAGLEWGEGRGGWVQVIKSKKNFNFILDDLEHIPDLKCVLDLERILDNMKAFLILNVLFENFLFVLFLYKSFQHFKNVFYAFVLFSVQWDRS